MKTVKNLLLICTLMISSLAFAQGTNTPSLQADLNDLKAIAEDEEAVTQEQRAFEEEFQMEQFRLNLRQAYDEMKQAEEPEELVGSL